MTSNVQAIGLGRIVVNSALNQPFDAEISIASIEDDVLESLEIKLATDSDFRRANIPIEPVVKSLQFNVINGETGPWIRVSTDNPVRIPFLHFLAAIGWSGGKIIREYTALLDPPGYDTVAGQSIALPSTTGQRAIQPGDTYEPVRSGETLMGIAANIDVDKSVTIYQRMFALMHMNSEAFIRGNMNLLREGATLIIPSVEMMAGISRILAREEYTRQLSDWIDYHQGIAQGRSQSGERLWVSLIPGDEKIVVKEVEKIVIKEVPIEKVVVKEVEKIVIKEVLVNQSEAGQNNKRASADSNTTTTGEYVLRIVQPDLDTQPAAVSKSFDAVPVPADQPSIDPELEKVKHRLTLTEETLASKELENEKLLRQIALLAEQIDKSARLIALQDEALALAQQQATLRAQQAAAASSVRPPDTTAVLTASDTAVEGSQTSVDQTTGDDDQTTVLATTDTAGDSTQTSVDQTTGGDSTQTSVDQTTGDDDQTTVLATTDTAGGGSQGTSNESASTGSGTNEKNASQQDSNTSERAVVTTSNTVDDEKVKSTGSLAVATEKESGQQNTSDRGPVEALTGVLRNLTTVDELKKLYQKDEQLVAMLSAAIILILLLLLLVLRRRRLANQDNSASAAMPIVMPAVTGGRDTEISTQQLPGAKPGEEPNARSEDPGIAERSGDASPDGGKATTDPISEADIYLTYGHRDQAEQVLASAIVSEPTRADLKLKLLEVYQAQANLEKFEQTASQLSTSLSADTPEWVSVVQMGRAMSSNNPLFTATSLSRHDPDNDIASDDDSGIEEIGIDLELEEPGVELSTSTASSQSDVQANETTRSSPADLEFAEDPVKAGDPVKHPADETASGSSASGTEASTEDPDNADSMDVGTRLDLARAYVEMGDNSTAKNLLNEVIQHGDAGQRASAQAILTNLDSK
ncbi:MAG TPA: hypothetical protein EYN87_00830 [Gammaproteobacteria bacterium]|nr:hypothetical protein [Gammaproteobacteria bacterium]